MFREKISKLIYAKDVVEIILLLHHEHLSDIFLFFIEKISESIPAEDVGGVIGS